MAASVRRLVVALALLAPPAARAQQPDTTGVYRAMDLEVAGHYRQAAALYRPLLRTAVATNAILGLERVYAQLGWTDSLLVPLDSLVAESPREPVFHSVQVRAYTMLSRDADARRAFDAWTRALPGTASPYREYSQLLIQRGRPAAADSIIQLAGHMLGTTSGLQLQLALSRAAMGQWEASARAWRGALLESPDLDEAAAYSLAPAPETARQTVRAVFLALPVDVGARRALAALETGWGSPADGWAALRDLPPDSESVAAWTDFAKRAESDEDWALARDALIAALRWRPTPQLALDAATAALNAGDARTALALAPAGGLDSAREAATVLPLRVRALAASGQPAQAETLVRAYAHLLSPLQSASLERAVSFGWVRAGNLDQARQALDRAGPDADSSDAAGWLALYQGNLAGARIMLRTSTDVSSQLAQALGLITRMTEDTAADVGHAFLALARLDSTGAAQAFEQAAAHHPDAASVLLATSAEIRNAQHDTAAAVSLWARILKDYAEAPEAPGAELAWARQLRRAGNSAGATAHLEHMILTYPESALVPQARRELELARQAIPGGGGATR